MLVVRIGLRLPWQRFALCECSCWLVCLRLYVCLLATLYENYRSDLYENFTRHAFLDKEVTILEVIHISIGI